MSRKKQLNISGNLIKSHQITINKVKNEYANTDVEVIILNITTNDDNYKYRICKDKINPDLVQTKIRIEECLTRVKNEYLNIKISENSKYNQLFFEVKEIPLQQYTGIRI